MQRYNYKEFHPQVEEKLKEAQQDMRGFMIHFVESMGGRAAASQITEYDLEDLDFAIRRVCESVLSQAEWVETSKRLEESEEMSRRLFGGIMASIKEPLDPLEAGSVVALTRDGMDGDEALELVKSTRRHRQEFHELREGAEGAEP